MRQTANVLPGFGPKTSAALAAIGIATVEELKRRDPFALYAALKGRDDSVSLNFLYALIAAVEGCDWRDVRKTRRTEILLRLDEMGLAPK